MDLDTEYLTFMEHANQNGHVINICTITYLCETSAKHIPLHLLQKLSETLLRDYGFQLGTTGLRRSQKKTQPQPQPQPEEEDRNRNRNRKKTSERAASFFNQVTLRYQDDVSRKSVKVFTNGKLQLTGLVSLSECRFVAMYVVDTLNRLLGQDFTLVNAYVGLMNANFNLCVSVDLRKLHHIFNTQPSHVLALYNPETYPAINLKYTHPTGARTSVFIFGSGSVVMSGGKSMQELHNTYTYLTNLISQHRTDIVLPKIATVKRKRERADVEYVHGYPIREYMNATLGTQH